MERKELLETLLNFKSPLNIIIGVLKQFPWDSDIEYVQLKSKHIISILKRYQKGEISAKEVENWANLIEGRDDIGFDPRFYDLLQNIIYELANPLLTKPLSLEEVQKWINLLQKKKS